MTRHLDRRLKVRHLRRIELIAAYGSLLKAFAALGLTVTRAARG